MIKKIHLKSKDLSERSRVAFNNLSSNLGAEGGAKILPGNYIPKASLEKAGIDTKKYYKMGIYRDNPPIQAF